jgi:hypothetical protein
MLADVDAGSDTPSLVGKVLRWRKEDPLTGMYEPPLPYSTSHPISWRSLVLSGRHKPIIGADSLEIEGAAFPKPGNLPRKPQVFIDYQSRSGAIQRSYPSPLLMDCH